MSSGSDGLFDACFLILLFFGDSLWHSIKGVIFIEENKAPTYEDSE